MAMYCVTAPILSSLQLKPHAQLQNITYNRQTRVLLQDPDSKFVPLCPRAIHPPILCTRTQRTGTVADGIGMGAPTAHLPWSLQQQNQICLANELAVGILDVSPPSETDCAFRAHCYSLTRKLDPAVPAVHLREWGEMGGRLPLKKKKNSAYVSSLLPSAEHFSQKEAKSGTFFNIEAENERHYQ